MMKRGAVESKTLFLLVFIILIVSGGLFITQKYGLSTIFAVNSGDTITVYSPDWTTLKCDYLRNDNDEYTAFAHQGRNLHYTDYNLQEDSYTTITCSPFAPNGCGINLKINEAQFKSAAGLCTARFQIFRCDVNGGNCVEVFFKSAADDLSQYTNYQQLFLLSLGEQLRVRAWSTGGFLCGVNENPIPSNIIFLQKEYEVWGLTVTGDAAYQERENTCTIGSEKARILDGDIQNNPLLFSGGEGVNYVSYVNEWNPTTLSSIYDYKGKEVYCTGLGKLYELKDINLEDGSARTLYPTTLLTTPETECCPSQQGCNDNFIWDSVVDPECTSDLQCPSGGAWYTSGNKKAQRWVCQSEICTQEIKSVACSVNADCPGGWCDKINSNPSNWECKTNSPPADYCGDGLCNSLTETVTNCPVDCTVSAEVCDGIDNDKDGQIDEGCKEEEKLSALLIIISLITAIFITVNARKLINLYSGSNSWVKPLLYIGIFFLSLILSAMLFKEIIIWIKSLFSFGGL